MKTSDQFQDLDAVTPGKGLRCLIAGWVGYRAGSFVL
jgi:hypothetical protein